MPTRTGRRRSRRRHWGYWIGFGLGALAVVLGIGYFSGFFYSAGILQCYPPPGWAVDGEAIAYALVWQDTDGNGLMEDGEPPLSGVTVQMAYAECTTDATGQCVVAVFKPGCACKCWEGEAVSAEAPPRHRPTTPTTIRLTGEDGFYQFGFARE